ncbi:MAG TPA: DUF364 domain-containing protein [Geobacteraceae bacterium]|nr:DUF364 domain-containing protein [Geobacteraceae bacterium]
MDILDQARLKLREICTENKLDGNERITVRTLTPDEAIGEKADKNFVIKKGLERVIEARFRDTAGQAFTDAPGDWEGTLSELFDLNLEESRNRAFFTAGLNALMRFLNLAEGTVHCKDDEPTKCGGEMPELIRQRYGTRRYGMIGLQPAILKEMVDGYGKSGVCVADLNPDNIGQIREELLVMDGEKELDKLVEWCDVGLATGSSVVNGTINEIVEKFTAAGKPVVFFGNTIAGVAALTNLERICPFGR